MFWPKWPKFAKIGHTAAFVIVIEGGGKFGRKMPAIVSLIYAHLVIETL